MRQDEQGRLTALLKRLADMDRLATPHAFVAVEQSVLATKDRLGAIEAELLGHQVEAPPQLDLEDQYQARIEMRGRLHHLLLVLDRHAPESCQDAARELRRKIDIELQELEGR